MFDKAKQHLNDMEVFINHNLKLGYLSKENTIDELLHFLNNIKTQYIPIQEDIQKKYL